MDRPFQLLPQLAVAILLLLPVSVAQPQDGAGNAAIQWPLYRQSASGRAYVSETIDCPVEQVWSFTDEGAVGFESSPIAVNNRVFIGSYDGYFYALDAQTGAVCWKYKTEAGFVATAGFFDGCVFCGDSDGIFYCWDAEKGKLIWKFDTQRQIYSAPGFYRNLVLFNNQAGLFYALDCKTGKMIRQYKADDQLRSSVTIAQNRAFLCGCDAHLHIIDLDTFERVLYVDLGAPSGGTAALTADALFLGTEGNEVLAIQWKQGTVRWRFQNAKSPAPFRSSPAVGAQGLVYVGSNDRRLYALEEKSGKERWSFRTKRTVEGSPIILDDKVAFGSTDGRLYLLDAETGKELDSVDLGDSILSAPCYANGKLFVSTTGGVLYCFQSGKK